MEATLEERHKIARDGSEEGFENDRRIQRNALCRHRKVGTLKTRRLRGDLIEVFKILRGFEDVDKNIFFKSSSIELRGHSEKLCQGRSRLNCRYNDFSQRIVNSWDME